jgi:predicted amidohydrolase
MQVTVATAQYPITYHHDFQSWKAHVTAWVEKAVERNANLLLFPEYGAMELVSIFDKAIHADIEQQIVQLDTLLHDFCSVWAELARLYNVVIVAPSIPVFENGVPVNRVFVFAERGLVGYQDKFFMTRFENEIWGIRSGEKVLSIFEAGWGSFGIQICYDVEFPIGTHLLSQNGATLVLAPSCTETIRGATRVHVGARARAMENQLYTIVSQTVNDALWSPVVDINYGYSAVYSTADMQLPEEGIVDIQPAQSEGWLVTSLDMSLLAQVRENGQVFNYKDSCQVNMLLNNEKIRIKKYQI